MNRSAPLVCLVLAALTLMGCGTVTTLIQINPSPRPLTPRPPESVEIYTLGPPSRPYREVAMLRAQGTADESGFEDAGRKEEALFHQLRTLGAGAGCDALVILRYDGLVPSVFSPRAVPAFRATCIVYQQPGQPAQPTERGEQVAPPLQPPRS